MQTYVKLVGVRGRRRPEPVAFATVAGLLAAVALLACFLPARRAMRIDPVDTVRYE